MNTDAVIIFPPPMDRIARVYPAPHFLSAFINKNGFRAKPLDLNLVAMCRLADASRLNDELNAVTMKIQTLESKSRPTKEETSRYLALQRSLARLLFALRNRLHDKTGAELMDMELDGIRYTRVFIDVYLKAFGDFYRNPVPSLKEIPSLKRSPAAVNLRSLLEDVIREEIVDKQVPVIGFSIPFGEQFVPAIVLAEAIRSRLPRVHICFGGPVITLLSESYLRGLMNITPVDTVIQYGGETPFLELLNAKLRGKSIDGIDRLVTPKTTVSAASNRVSKPPRRPLDRCHRLHPTKLRHMPKRSPLPITQSTGCYWKKCTFCDYVNLHRDKTYRPRAVSDIIDDITHYTNMGFTNFRMLTEAIPPRDAGAIAEALIRHRLSIKWHAFIRIDRRFTLDTLKALKESGFTCTIGMESADDDVLKTLNKGYRRETIQYLFDNMRAASLSDNHLNIMVGVPGTTYARDLNTYRFCREYKDIIKVYKSFVFRLTRTSEMGKHPEKFGIVLPKDNKDDPFDPKSCLTAIGFTDPGGMRGEEKKRVMARYEQLNKEIRIENGHNGLRRLLSSAKSIGELDGMTFTVPRKSLMTIPVMPSHVGTGKRNGEVRYMLVNMAEARDHQFLAEVRQIDLLESLPNGEFQSGDVLELLSDPQQTVDFIQAMFNNRVVTVEKVGRT